MVKKGAEAAIKWYQVNKPLYESLSRKVEQIVKENLEQRHIVYHSVTSRGKSLDSFSRKAQKDKYSDPAAEIKDMAGVRIITYLESDVQKVATVVEELFSIDKDNSIDQSKLLGSDKVGYRCVHYVAEFDSERCKLPEYRPHAGLPFEIQVRSLLQHAWAEIAHDRNYKFGGKLPTELERRFYLVAGILEVADREFVAIAEEIDKYKADVIEEIGKNELDIEITSLSLKEYLSKRFSEAIAAHIVEPSLGGTGEPLSKKIVDELRSFGISKLDELDRIVPSDLQGYILQNRATNNFGGLIRDILIINDAEKYFRVSWKQAWQGYDAQDNRLYEKYCVDQSILDEHVERA